MGPAMKIGQMASVLDIGALPPEEVERLQAKLGELRERAPQAPFKEMRGVIEQDLGERIEDVFAEFDRDAAAAASIGQVYRARLHDGREVAVKVQYPRVAAAVRADLQNLGLIMRAAKRFAPGLDPATTASELRERISEELDYEHEAQAQRAFARRWRGHPFIVDPERGDQPVPHPGARQRVDRRDRLRADQGGYRRPPATVSARSSFGSSSVRCTALGVLRRSPSRQLPAARRRTSRVS